MEKQVRHRIASRDYRLMVGVLFLAVSVTAVVCAAVALGSIGRSTQQTNEALDAAITAYDRYLQEISSGEPWTQELSVLNEGDFLATLSRRIRQAEDAGERATLVAQLQGLVAQFERESLASGANLYVYDPSRGLLTGASYFGPYADAPDARLAQVDVGACLAEGRSISHLVTGGGDGSEDPPFSMVRFAEVLPGCVLVEFHDMPELPGLDMLSPISDMTELFFVDRYGNVCAYWGRDACAAAVSFQELETGDSAQSGILTVEHADRSYRCYYHDACAGYLKFALVAPNVAREAYEQFALGIIVAAGVLIVLGCAMGALLTRRIYAPLREIIQRLTPADQAEHDEFRLVALAIRAMERRLGEQAGAVEGYHLARLLHGQADAERESRGFFFGGAGCSDPPGGDAPCAGAGGHRGSRSNAGMPCAVLAVRPDEDADLDALEGCVRRHLHARWGEVAVCQDAPGIVLAVVGAEGGGTFALAQQLQRDLKCQEGFLVSVFVSGVHDAPHALPTCYRETVDLVELKGEAAFCQVFAYDSALPVGNARGESELEGAGCPSRSFDALLAFVTANYRDPNLSAGTVARAFGTSQPNVSRLFRRHGYGGFLECVHSLRIAHAKRLLLEGNISISEVARAVGYGSDLTMTRAFKRYVGQTPGAFREGGGEGEYGPLVV